MTCEIVRWASTWSGPSWASSSVTKIAVLFQYGEWETASTSRPRERSLSAVYAAGVGLPGVVPALWSFGSRTNSTVGRLLPATYWLNSFSHSVNRGVPHVALSGAKVSGFSGQFRSKPRKLWSVLALSAGSLATNWLATLST